jgi:hypothetical protein
MDFRSDWPLYSLGAAAVLLVVVGAGGVFYSLFNTAPRAKLTEQKQFEDARGDLSKLEAYVSSCKLCEHKQSASSEIERLRTAEVRAKENAAFLALQVSLENYERYVHECKICEHKAAAEKTIEKLKDVTPVKREANLDSRFLGVLEIISDTSAKKSYCRAGRFFPVTIIVSDKTVSIAHSGHVVSGGLDESNYFRVDYREPVEGGNEFTLAKGDRYYSGKLSADTLEASFVSIDNDHCQGFITAKRVRTQAPESSSK